MFCRSRHPVYPYGALSYGLARMARRGQGASVGKAEVITFSLPILLHCNKIDGLMNGMKWTPWMQMMFLCIMMSAALSCSKDEQMETDQMLIDDYLENNSLTAQSTSSGLHYIIHTPGNNEHPDVSNTVILAYTGKLLNGSEFDANTYFTYQLSGLIEGWQEGVPLIGKGGSITLIVPSHLAYGDQSYPGIPANSVLVFDIQLFDFY